MGAAHPPGLPDTHLAHTSTKWVWGFPWPWALPTFRDHLSRAFLQLSGNPHTVPAPVWATALLLPPSSSSPFPEQHLGRNLQVSPACPPWGLRTPPAVRDPPAAETAELEQHLWPNTSVWGAKKPRGQDILVHLFSSFPSRLGEASQTNTCSISPHPHSPGSARIWDSWVTSQKSLNSL